MGYPRASGIEMWALQFTLLSLTKRPNGTEKAIKEKLIMSFFKNLFSKTKVVQSFNSEMMIETAIKWTVDFMTTAPKLSRATYNQDEVYMFCAWVVLDYGMSFGYLDEKASVEGFFLSIFKAVRNTGKYQQSEMEQFTFRVGQYRSEMTDFLKCDYPKTKMFFPETLFARFTNIAHDNFPSSREMEVNLFEFTDFFGKFWNKINRELMAKFPRKK